MRKLVKFLM